MTLRSAAIALALSCAALAGPALAQETEADLVERGRYVALAADCAACHTAPHGGAPYAGGYAIQSPMGAIVATNITPSTEFGIGNWTEEEFVRAVREGVSPNGNLYPAMPYTAYGSMTDGDMHALWAYIRSVPAVDEAPRAKTELAFPFNQRWSMIGWNLLFADAPEFAPEDVAPGAPRRGEYLANALAHCQTCHTPRNALMGEDGGAYLAGGPLGGWYAPNITSDPVSGIGGWSRDELIAYMRDGVAHGKAQAAGPMAEAVGLSLRHLTEDDLGEIADYLHSVPPIRDPGQTVPAYAFTQATPLTPAEADPAIDYAPEAMADSSSTDGSRIYNASCASCHQLSGAGTGDRFYPSLTSNARLGGTRPDGAVMAIVEGIHRETNAGEVAMPAFGHQLDDAQIASVTNFIFARFGNSDVSVTADDVTLLRQGGEPPLLVRLMPWLMALGGLFAVLVVGGIVWLVRRRRGRITA